MASDSTTHSQSPRAGRAKRARRIAAIAIPASLGIAFLPCLFRPPPRPPGLHLALGPWPVATNACRLLLDTTAFDPASGQRIVRQDIFDACLEVIRNAHSVLYLDFFLWNDWQGPTPETHRALASELAAAVIARKQARPNLSVVVLTDPINRAYGRDEPDCLRDIARAGIPVVFTDLDRLPDSNRLYAQPARFWGGLLLRIPALHRACWKRSLHNPLNRAGTAISPAQMARLLFFKANHRKLLIGDDDVGNWHLVVGSMNPADGSAAHSNIGLHLQSAAAAAVLGGELDIVEWSASNPSCVLERQAVDPADVIAPLRAAAARAIATAALTNTSQHTGPRALWLTDGAIRDRLIRLLDDVGPGDQVRIAMFYLSDRRVLAAIRRAADNGASVRIILDRNRDAFGRTKNGVPNRPVAAALNAYAIANHLDMRIRWAETRGEQFHPKAMSITRSTPASCAFLCGSANWTRRNLGHLNLEADLLLLDETDVVARYNRHFDILWTNADSLHHTAAFGQYVERGWRFALKGWVGAIQEATGLGTF